MAILLKKSHRTAVAAFFPFIPLGCRSMMDSSIGGKREKWRTSCDLWVREGNAGAANVPVRVFVVGRLSRLSKREDALGIDIHAYIYI